MAKRERINYATGADHPRLIQLCCACDKQNCDGLCHEYRKLYREIIGGHQMRGGKLLPYQGEMLTITEIARRSGISRETIYKRLQSGASLEEAVVPPKHRRGVRVYVTYRGERYTVGRLAQIMGINKSTLYWRLECGMTPEDAVDGIHAKNTGRRPKLYTAFGKSLPLYEWARQIGYSISTLRQYMSRGMTLEQIAERAGINIE